LVFLVLCGQNATVRDTYNDSIFFHQRVVIPDLKYVKMEKQHPPASKCQHGDLISVLFLVSAKTGIAQGATTR
jgi:hypothetical protein